MIVFVMMVAKCYYQDEDEANFDDDDYNEESADRIEWEVKSGGVAVAESC